MRERHTNLTTRRSKDHDSPATIAIDMTVTPLKVSNPNRSYGSSSLKGWKKMVSLLGLSAVLLMTLHYLKTTQLSQSLFNLRKPDSLSNEFRSLGEEKVKQRKTSMKLCSPEIKTLDKIQKSNLKSQFGEDKFLLASLPNLCNGTYIEMGAFNGMEMSNTYVLNKELGWKGILIEGNPNQKANLMQNRPNEIALVNAGVCKEVTTVHYVEAWGPVSGIWEFASPTFREKWWKNIEFDSPKVKPIQCMPLTNIIQENMAGLAVTADAAAPTGKILIDFFSLDVEGGELEVLQSVDFNTIEFGMIVVEQDDHNPKKDLEVVNMLVKEGYIYLGLKTFHGAWFKHPNFNDIYNNLF
jgi:hypothetical protein